MNLEKKLRGWILFFFFGILPSVAYGGIPQVSDVNVTDVTPVSFSVVWVVSEPSTVNLRVFQSPACVTPVAGITVSSFSLTTTGVSKAAVTGLNGATSYCYQIEATSQSTLELTLSPASPALVTTETMVVRSHLSGPDLLPFGNDLLYAPSYLPDQATPANETILVASVPGGAYPVSGLIGEGIASPNALIDLNNLFNGTARETFNLLGDERLKLLEIRGSSGCTLDRWRKVPVDSGLVEVKAPDACFDKGDLDCNDTINILDILRDIGGFDTAVGGFCFNSDLDMNGNGAVNILDILYVVGKFGTNR